MRVLYRNRDYEAHYRAHFDAIFRLAGCCIGGRPSAVTKLLGS